jgi:putative membrane protein
VRPGDRRIRAGAALSAERACRIALAVMGGGLVLSGIAPFERGTWLLEVFPVLVVMPLLWLTRNRFALTPLTIGLIAAFALILETGGHYTYARVPLGFWMRDALELTRNNFDRLGHFAQGFVPAMVAREILLRRTPLRPGGWLFVLVSATSLSISACYEFVEWWSALLLGSGATEFLATQGDPWDTQWDMFLAFCGAMTAQLLLARMHDRALARLPGREANGHAGP